MTPNSFDLIASKLLAGEPLANVDITKLSVSRDLIQLGSLADQLRRARCGDQVTFVRVFEVSVEADVTELEFPAAAGEVRLNGCPDSVDSVIELVHRVVPLAGDVPVTGFELNCLVGLCNEDVRMFERFVRRLKESGLAMIAEAPLDKIDDSSWIERSAGIGLAVARLTVHGTASVKDAVRRVSSWGCATGVKAFAPLPRRTVGMPSTGYEDVRQVALARLLVDNIPSIQVDWSLYGPKLAQVALTFGASDVDSVSPVDSLEHGRRRAPLEVVKQNIRAASLVPVQRNGRFETMS